MNVIDKTIEKIKERIIEQHEVDQLERAASFTLADAIRLGSEVSGQAHDWTDGENLCALSAAVCAAESLDLL